MGGFFDIMAVVILIGIAGLASIQFFSSASTAQNITSNTSSFTNLSQNINTTTNSFNSIENNMSQLVNTNISQSITSFGTLGTAWNILVGTFDLATSVPIFFLNLLSLAPLGLSGTFVEAGVKLIFGLFILYMIFNIFQSKKET